VAGLGQFAWILYVCREIEIEWCAILELGKKVAGRAVSHLDGCAGLVGLELCHELVHRELQVRGGGNRELSGA
jgi:hypothetical protein